MEISGPTPIPNRYNDGRNLGSYYYGDTQLVIDKYSDDDYPFYPPYVEDGYGPGDAVILLKMGDGFSVHQGCSCP